MECEAKGAYNMECSAIVTLAPDPFEEEIYGNSTEVWMCEVHRNERARDV